MANGFVIVLLVIVQFNIQTSADMYAAVTQLEPLYEIEQRLLNVTKEYIQEERRKLAGLKQFAKAAEMASKLSLGDPLEYIANPINSYLLLKRFTWGWKELSDLLHFSDEKLAGKTISQHVFVKVLFYSFVSNFIVFTTHRSQIKAPFT